MRPRLGHVLVLGALVCTLAAGALAQADPAVESQPDSKARIVRLSFVQGDVSLERPESGGLDTAFLNMPIVEGSRVVTGDDGFAELEFESGGTVRLTPGGELRVRELGLRGEHQVSMLELTEGTAYFNVKKDPDDDFRVVINGQELRVAKSARFRIRGGRGNAEIAVTKGEIELIGSAQSVRIKQDETLTLDPQDPGRYFLARSVTPFAYDTWDRERDDYRQRYVATSNSYRGYSSGYSYGVSDLNYYGSYSNVAGYGYVWRPYGYDVGWDPFSDGAWVWYPGYGYTWVSGYAWGWMPYRYGRWIYIGGYGWVWQPGNHWRRWNTCSAVYHPPRHYRHPTPPPHAGGTGGGGGHQGGGTGSGGGGQGGGGRRVVVVGKGPFTGRGPGWRTDDDAGPRINRGQGRSAAVGSGNSVPAPAVLTPGLGAPVVQTPGSLTSGSQSMGSQSTGAVAEALRQVHGQDLGLPRSTRWQAAGQAASTTNVTPNSGSAAGGSTAGSETAKPVQPIVTPPRPVRGGGQSPSDASVATSDSVTTTPATGSTATTTTTAPTTVIMPARPAQTWSPQASPSQASPSQPRPAQASPSPPRSAPSQPSGSGYRGGSGSSGGGTSSRGSSSPSSTASGSGSRSSSSSSTPARSQSSSSHSSSQKDPK